MTSQEQIREKQKELFALCKDNHFQCLIFTDDKGSDCYDVHINLRTTPDVEATESDYLRLINNLSEAVFKLSKGNYCIKQLTP